MGGKRSHENIHQDAPQHAVDHRREKIGTLEGDKVIEKTQWIEQARLDIPNHGRAGELVGIPERKGSMMSDMVLDKTQYRLEVECEIASVQAFAGHQDFKKQTKDTSGG